MKQILILFTLLTYAVGTMAQDYSQRNTTSGYGPFKTLDVALTAGATGVGFDVSSKLNDMVQVRMGYSIMPHFTVPMHFNLGMYDGNNSFSESKLDKMSGFFEDFTGFRLKKTVEMEGTPTYHNFKLLVDVFPFRNKHWHLTAGFYYGNRQIGYAENATESATALVGLGIYNSFYSKLPDADKLQQIKDVFGKFNNMDLAQTLGQFKPELAEPINAHGGIPVLNVNGDIYERMIESSESQLRGDDIPWGTLVFPDGFELECFSDPFINETQFRKDASEYQMLQAVNQLQQIQGNDQIPNMIEMLLKMKQYGLIGAYIADYKNGEKYILQPDDNAMVKVRAYANRFKPYFGFGYGGPIDKTKRFNLSFDCGVMFWGGSPDIVVHDGVSLKYDVTNVRGKVGDYVKIAGKFPVMPVLDLRLAYRIF